MSSTDANPQAQPETIKDTLISIVIAFALAFVFRGFVVEAFVIPTGSMAPTLMGAHIRVQNPESGYSWPIEPWDIPSTARTTGVYTAVQGSTQAITVNDPLTGQLQTRRNLPLMSGDRILVLKYLYSVMDPQRFDVIVFKNPENPTENYIKRLIGLPGEEIALVDGDVFVRTGGVPAGQSDRNLWAQDGWKIARKPPVVQQATWQPVFDSSYTPPAPNTFTPPWASQQPGWTLSDTPSYTYTGTARTDLVFDQTRPRFNDPALMPPERRERWTIDDRYAYDEVPRQGLGFQLDSRYPVSDLRLRAGIEAQAEGLSAEALLTIRGRDFRMRISGGRAELAHRAAGGATPAPWETVASADAPAFTPGTIVNVSFWHADQAIGLEINDTQVFEPWSYEWGPSERILQATGRELADLIAANRGENGNPLQDPALYRRPDVRWAFEGAPLRLHRVALDRDLHYQPAQSRNKPYGSARGTGPDYPLTLNGDQFFSCGDNSPASLDGRLFSTINPWVAQQFDNTIGVIPRELLLGRAFFVYWPSLHKGKGAIPVPDFGRMRFIW
jgi:signal peptidase I